MAYDVGAVHSSSADARGNRVNYVGKYVDVWKKDATGQWRVAVEISNSDGVTGHSDMADIGSQPL
jgi:ketosteroid isomerase-like protein